MTMRLLPVLLMSAILAIAPTSLLAEEAAKATTVEQAVLEAPNSASAWLAVAKDHDGRGELTPAILAYARYLTLAKADETAKAAASRLWSLVVPREESKEIAMRPQGGDQDKWWGTDMMLTKVRSNRHAGRTAAMSDAEFFATMLEGAALLSNSMAVNGQLSPMWQTVGIPYFLEARAQGHLLSLAFDVTRPLGAPETKAWLAANVEAVDSFHAWSKEWKPGAAPAP
jgi:hypothetical protein